jgi:hypothetical protein
MFIWGWFVMLRDRTAAGDSLFHLITATLGRGPPPPGGCQDTRRMDGSQGEFGCGLVRTYDKSRKKSTESNRDDYHDWIRKSVIPHPSMNFNDFCLVGAVVRKFSLSLCRIM